MGRLDNGAGKETNNRLKEYIKKLKSTECVIGPMPSSFLLHLANVRPWQETGGQKMGEWVGRVGKLECISCLLQGTRKCSPKMCLFGI